MPAMPLGIALRSGFAMNAQNVEKKECFRVGFKTNESVTAMNATKKIWIW
jgi:hypothetical protein